MTYAVELTDSAWEVTAVGQTGLDVVRSDATESKDWRSTTPVVVELSGTNTVEVEEA